MAVALTATAVLSLIAQYPSWDHDKALWVAQHESTLRADVISSNGRWVGLFQIDWQLEGMTVAQLQDAATNVEHAYQMYLARGWQPWPVAASYPGTEATVGIVDGWLSWAERVPGPTDKVNAGTNPVEGIFFHSAEGYENGLRSQLASAPVSWHLSNLQDGRMLQHYPFTARCWHATAANQSYIGMEHEGVAGQALTDAQVANDKRVIADVSAWKGWAPRRPLTKTDLDATLYEHTEVIRFGGTATACPSGRIPWDKILGGDDLADLKGDGSMKIVAEGDVMAFYVQGVRVLTLGGQTPGQIQKLFGDRYYSLAHQAAPDGHNAPAVFSDQLTD